MLGFKVSIPFMPPTPVPRFCNSQLQTCFRRWFPSVTKMLLWHQIKSVFKTNILIQYLVSKLVQKYHMMKILLKFKHR